MPVILDQMNMLREQSPDPTITPEITRDIEKIIAHCNKHYTDQLFYGSAALNRKIVLDPEVVHLLSPEVLKVIFNDKFAEPFKISRNSGHGAVLLRDAIYHAFIDGPETVKFMPNNDRHFGIEEYQTQKDAFEKTTKALIQNIAIAANTEEPVIQAKNTLHQIDLNSQVNIIRTAIDKIRAYNQSKLLSVPGYSTSQIENQTINGFETLLLLNGFEANQFHRIDGSLESFCETILENPKALLHGDVIHLFYDRVHLEAAFSSEFSIDFSNGSFTLGDILEELYSKVARNPDKYPIAFEQLSVRLTLVQKDLENRFSEDYKEACVLSEGLIQGPSQKNDALEDVEYVLYAIAGLEHPNHSSNGQSPKNVNFRLNSLDQIIVSCPDGREYNLSCALKNANLEYFKLNQELHKPLFLGLKSKNLIQYTDTLSESLRDPNNQDDPILLSEQAAITAYSEESDIPNYQIMNALLRGNISDFTSDHKQLILSNVEKHFVNCMLAISGVNKNIKREVLDEDRDKPVYYRVEKSPPAHVLMGMASPGQVTPYAGFVSYEEGRTHPDLQKNMITRIRGGDTRQKSIKSVSSLNGENETLFSPLHLRYSNARVNQSGILTVDANIVQGLSTENNNNYFVDLVLSEAYEKLTQNKKRERLEIVRAVSYVDHVISYFKNHAADKALKEYCVSLENVDIQLIKVLLILSMCFEKNVIPEEAASQFITDHFTYLSRENIEKYIAIINGENDGLLSHIISLSKKLDSKSSDESYSPTSGFVFDNESANKDYCLLKEISNESVFFTSENKLSKDSDREAIAYCTENTFYAQSFIKVISLAAKTKNSEDISFYLSKTSDLYKKITIRRKLSIILNNEILIPYLEKISDYIENNAVYLDVFLINLDYFSRNCPSFINFNEFFNSKIGLLLDRKIQAFNILIKSGMMNQALFNKVDKLSSYQVFDSIIQLQKNNLLTIENLQRLLDAKNSNVTVSVIIALDNDSLRNDENIALSLKSSAPKKFATSLVLLSKNDVALDESATIFLAESRFPEHYANLFLLLKKEGILNNDNIEFIKLSRNPEIVANLLIFLKSSVVIENSDIKKYDSQCQHPEFPLKIFSDLKEKNFTFDKELIDLIFSGKQLPQGLREIWEILNNFDLTNCEFTKLLLNSPDSYFTTKLKKSFDVLKDHNLLTKENVEKLLAEKENHTRFAAHLVLEKTMLDKETINKILTREELISKSIFLKKIGLLNMSTCEKLFSASYDALSIFQLFSENNFPIDNDRCEFILSHNSISYERKIRIEDLLKTKLLTWDAFYFLMENKIIETINPDELSYVLHALGKYKLLNKEILGLFFKTTDSDYPEDQFTFLSSIVKCLNKGNSLDAETFFYLVDNKEKFLALLKSGLGLNRNEFNIISKFCNDEDISQVLVNLKTGFYHEEGGIFSVPKVSYPLADQFFSIVLQSKNPIPLSELITLSFQKNFFISDDPLTFDQKLFTHPNQGELLHLIQICEKSKILSKENYNILLKTEKIPQEIFSILEVLEKNNIALKEKDLNELLQSKSLYLILSFLDVLKDSNCLNESSAPILLNNSLNENTLLNAINTLLDLKDYPKNAKFMSYLLDFLQSSFSETADQKSYNDTLFKAMTLNNPDSVIKLSFNEFKESCIQNLLSVCEKNRYKVVIGEDFFHVFPASDKRNNFFTSQDSPLTTTLNKLFTAIQKSKSVSDIEETLKEQNNIPNFSIFCNYVIKNKSLVSNETTQSLKSTT